MHQLATRQIDRNVKGATRRLPARRLFRGLLQRPATQGHDRPRALRQRDEHRRSNGAELRVLPSHQRLCPDHRSVGERHDGLVVHLELSPLESPSELSLQMKLLHRVRTSGVIQDVVAATTNRLGPVHGSVSCAHQLPCGVGAVADHDPNTRPDDIRRAVIEHDGSVQRFQHTFGDSRRL